MSISIKDIPMMENLDADKARGVFGGFSFNLTGSSYGYQSINLSNLNKPDVQFKGHDLQSSINPFEGLNGIGGDGRLAGSNDAITGDSGAMGSPG